MDFEQNDKMDFQPDDSVEENTYDHLNPEVKFKQEFPEKSNEEILNFGNHFLDESGFCGTVHEGEKSHKCEICEEFFSTSKELRIHIRTFHSTKKPKIYNCEDCEAAFTNAKNLTNHINKVHTNVNILKCNYCDIDFNKLRNFTFTIRSSTYTLQLCWRIFITR